MSYIGQQLVNALTLAGLYSLVALGVSLTFGLTRLVNFAHGEILMLGGYMTFSCMSLGVPFSLALVLAFLGTFLVGLILERSLFRFTLSKPINGFIISLGLIIVIQNAVIMFYGSEPQMISSPLKTVWSLDGVRIPSARLVVFIVAAALIAGYLAFTKYSRWGRALRACNEDREGAALLGIPTNRIIMWTFAAGSGVAGLGGGLLAAMLPISAGKGTGYCEGVRDCAGGRLGQSKWRSGGFPDRRAS